MKTIPTSLLPVSVFVARVSLPKCIINNHSTLHQATKEFELPRLITPIILTHKHTNLKVQRLPPSLPFHHVTHPPCPMGMKHPPRPTNPLKAASTLHHPLYHSRFHPHTPIRFCHERKEWDCLKRKRVKELIRRVGGVVIGLLGVRYYLLRMRCETGDEKQSRWNVDLLIRNDSITNCPAPYFFPLPKLLDP